MYHLRAFHVPQVKNVVVALKYRFRTLNEMNYIGRWPGFQVQRDECARFRSFNRPSSEYRKYTKYILYIRLGSKRVNLMY